jgi:hypothetical protein
MGVKITLSTSIFAGSLIGAWFPRSGLGVRNARRTSRDRGLDGQVTVEPDHWTEADLIEAAAGKAACRIHHNECSLCFASPAAKPAFHANLRQIGPAGQAGFGPWIAAARAWTGSQAESVTTLRIAGIVQAGAVSQACAWERRISGSEDLSSSWF